MKIVRFAIQVVPDQSEMAAKTAPFEVFVAVIEIAYLFRPVPRGLFVAEAEIGDLFQLVRA